MHRFIVQSGLERGKEALLSPEEAAHASRVLRLRPGEEIELMDGAGRLFAAELTSVSREAVSARVKEELPSRESEIEVTLLQGLPKAEKMDWVVQKATELGVARMIPVRMERCVVKLDEKDAQKRRDRLQRIAAEAAKQCGRARTPVVEAAMDFSRALKEIDPQGLFIMPWEQASGAGIAQLRREAERPKGVYILIGPEGGISPREAGEAVECGARAVSLGPRILRTETAAIASVAMVMYAWGDLGGTI